MLPNERHSSGSTEPGCMNVTGRAASARAGYPEVFGYIESRGTPEDWKREKEYLSQWFETSGFGGGVGIITPKRHPRETVKALQIFREVVTKYPRTRSAPMAQYYSAVIFDYCLNGANNAVRQYNIFLQNVPNGDSYVDRAKKRVAELSARK
jgi:hypothetical protein